MFDTEMLKQLKQSNISENGEKTGLRVKEIWKAAKPDMKKAVVELSEISTGAVYRNIKTGSISIKLAIALGQVMNVNPFYLTGESDERDNYSENIAIKLIKKQGRYDKFLDEYKKHQKRIGIKQQSYTLSTSEDDIFKSDNGEKAKGRKEKSNNNKIISSVEESFFAEKDKETTILTMSDEDVMLLIRTLKLKAGLGLRSAMDEIKKLDEILLV
jgi:hypothetical protein